MNLLVWYRSLMRSVGATLVKLIATAASGLVSFTTNVIRPTKVICKFSPVQEGTGDPSPDNVRPISGWTGAILGNTVPAPESGIMFPFEPKQAGSGDPSPTNIRPISGYDLTLEDETHVTVYGGTVTLNEDGSADVVSDMRFRTLVGTESWATEAETGTYNMKFKLNLSDMMYGSSMTNVLTNYIKRRKSQNEGYKDGSLCCQFGWNDHRIFVLNATKDIDDVTDLASWKAYLAEHPLEIIYPLTTPITYHIDNVGQLKTFLGEIGYTAQLLPINWQTEAGTVYGGTVTLNEDGSADLVADTTIVDLGNYPFSQYGSSNHCWTGQIPPMSYVINNNPVVCCEEYKVLGPQSILSNGKNLAIWAYNSTKNARVIIRNDSFIGESGTYDIAALNNSLSGVHMCCRMKTPITYHFDNIGQLQSFLGTNNIWHNMNGSITAEYYKKQ